MIKLDNKGQTLVLFVVLIPIILMIMAMIIDLGNATILSHELDSNTYSVVKYGVDNINNSDVKEKMTKLFNENIDNGTIDINISDDYVYVNSSVKFDGIFSNMINIDIYDIKSSYKGTKKIDKYYIEKT